MTGWAYESGFTWCRHYDISVNQYFLIGADVYPCPLEVINFIERRDEISDMPDLISNSDSSDSDSDSDDDDVPFFASEPNQKFRKKKDDDRDDDGGRKSNVFMYLDMRGSNVSVSCAAESSGSGKAFMSKKSDLNTKQSAIDQQSDDSDDETWRRQVDETNQAISFLERALDDFEGKEKFESEKESQRQLDQITGTVPSAEADSLRPDNISYEIDEAMAEMGFELRGRRIIMPGWNPRSSQDHACELDRKWRSGEIQRANDERVRTYDDRKLSGELTAVEQVIEVSRSRLEGESLDDARQRLFGAGEVKRDFDEYVSQEKSDLPSSQLLREKSESEKSDEDQDDPPSPFIPTSPIESECEISNPPEKKSKHEFNVEECEGGSTNGSVLPSEFDSDENYQKYWAFVSKSSSVANSKTSVSEAFKYCLDGMANINVFTNPNLLLNIRTSAKPMSIDGIGGKRVLIDQVGDHPLFGLCWYVPQNEYNIVSQWQANQCGFTLKMSDDNEQAWLERKSDGVSVCFERDEKDHFYKCPVEKVAELIQSSDVLIGKINAKFGEELAGSALEEIYGNGNQRMLYTEDQLRKADIAEALHISMEHPSDAQLRAFIQSPSTLNCPVTVDDLKNLRAIKGPCKVCLEGKPKPNKGSHSTNDTAAEPTQPGELLHGDIVFIKGKPRMFTTDHITGYCTLNLMDSKSLVDVCTALEEVINAYRSHLKVVRRFSCDAESVLGACKTHLNSLGVKLEVRVPGEHEKYAERAMRVVRERMRVKLIELPYALPRNLHDALAAEVIRNMNILPNTKSFPLAPREMVRGDRVNVQTDIAPPFGSAVLSPVASASHSTEQKQEVGVAVGVSDSTKAGVRVYLLNKRNPVVRRGLKPMAMTQQVIDHMNDYATETKKVSKTIATGEIDEDDEPFYYIDTMAEEALSRAEDFYRDQYVPVPKGMSETLVKISYAPTLSTESTQSVPESQGADDIRESIEPEVSVEIPEVFESMMQTSPIVSPLPESPKKKSVKSRLTDVVPENIVESKRERKPSSKVASSKVNSAVLQNLVSKVFQMSLAKALSSEVGDAAKEAAKREIKQLVDLKTWVYLREPSDASPSVHDRETSCSMFLKPKYLANGAFSLWKARLVDGGHLTDPERYDPFEKTSPTVQLELVFVLLNLAVSHRMEVEGFDVPGAYLNATLKTGRFHKMRINKRIARLLMEVDPNASRYEQRDGSILVEIRKSLYGLPEAAQLWYEYLSGALRQGGYTMCPLDPCLFMRKKGGSSREISIIAIYVDDCLHVYRGANIRNELYASLRNAKLNNLKVDVLTVTSPISFLGLNIQKSSEDPRNIIVNQKGYLENLLDHYEEEIESYRGQARTPCDEHIFKPQYNAEDSVAIPVTPYMSKLMKVRYLVRSRPDIELTCAALCTRSRAPTVGDMKCANKLLKYLRETKDLGLLIRPTDMQTVYMADSAFAVHLTRKSHSGIVVGMGDETVFVPIHWRSLVQKLVTTSSTEAELVAIYDGLDFVIWIRRVLEWLGVPQRPTKLYQDNTSTITMVHMGRGSSGSHTKHIDIRYFFVKQFVDDHTIVIDHLAREHMLADFFASPRTGQTFRRMRNLLLGMAESA